jgi:hypothetical protein
MMVPRSNKLLDQGKPSIAMAGVCFERIVLSRVFDRRRRRFAPLTKQSSRNFLLPLRSTARSDQKRERGVHRAPFAFVVPHD